VQRALRPPFDPRLSVRLLRVHCGRLLGRLLADAAGGRSLLDARAAWEASPARMAAAHVAFVALVFTPRAILPCCLLATAAAGFASTRAAPAIGPDVWLNGGGAFSAAAAALAAAGDAPAAAPGGADTSPAADGGDWAAQPLALSTGGDGGEGLESLLSAALSDPEGGSTLSAAQQQRMFRQLALYGRAAQAVADAAATRLEQATAVFAWTEPLVSRAFFTACLLLALGLMYVPPRSLFLAAGLWAMRHPALRSRSDAPSILPVLLSRLTTKRDNLVL
jgi:hypothetical protein